MMVPIVNENQSHLNAHAVALRSRSAAFIRDLEISRTGPDIAQLSTVNTVLGNVEQVKSSSNVAARQIRTMDTQLQNMAYPIQRMVTDIRTFRKDFPPFPRGSEERELLLESFHGIRKQIERLTLPPKKDATPTLQDDSAAQIGPMNTLLERFIKVLKTIGAHIPSAPENAFDIAFQKLEEKLETLLGFIYQQRAELVEQKKYYGDDDDKELAVMMTSFSISMSQTFSDQSSWQMTVSQTHLKAWQA